MDSISLKYIHYSPKPLTLNPIGYLQYDHFKPNGLWFSVEGYEDDQTWKTWCEAEKFRLDTLEYPHEIQLKSDAKILQLYDAVDILNFTKRYRIELVGRLYNIEWGRVSQDYSGIIIAPYQWECRLEPSCFWYYGWDCASGCIWDLRVIKAMETYSNVTSS